jgi:hypothetical protein
VGHRVIVNCACKWPVFPRLCLLLRHTHPEWAIVSRSRLFTVLVPMDMPEHILFGIYYEAGSLRTRFRVLDGPYVCIKGTQI